MGKGGKKSASKGSPEVVLGGERVAKFHLPSPPPPSPGYRLARFAGQYFSYLTPFFAFFPHCVACEQQTHSGRRFSPSGNASAVRRLPTAEPGTRLTRWRLLSDVFERKVDYFILTTSFEKTTDLLH